MSERRSALAAHIARQAIILAPDDAKAWFNRGLALERVAGESGQPLNALIARIDAERLEAASPPNLASALRRPSARCRTPRVG